MNLTRETYHSIPADIGFMSVSQYKDFMNCEAAAMARLAGEYSPPTNDALLIGSYVHAWNEGALDTFKEDHPEMFTKQGKLYAKYEIADAMITALANDPFCMHVLKGRKEQILTGELGGVPWKIMVDVYVPGKRIVDIKTTRSITETIWNPELRCRESFIEAYRYPLQMAVYAHIERWCNPHREYLEPLIVAVSKENPPDKAVISINDPKRLLYEIGQIEQNIERVMDVKEGRKPPHKCGKCAYCRASKRVTKVTWYRDLEATA